MQDLAQRNLIIVAGKGGVGKTTTASAIALHLAKAGRKTMLVTVDPAKRLADSLGMEVGFSPTPVQPRLWAMMMDPASIIREHLQERIPQAKVVDHPLFRYVASNLPGLNELMAIGRLNDLRREGAYDVIVVDTAPTGHALSFLGAPKAIHDMLGETSLVKWAARIYDALQKVTNTVRRAGALFRRHDAKSALPDIDFERIFDDMRAEASRIQAFLRDPVHSALVLITIPEKLPVEETCDLEAAVRKDLGMKVHAVVVNKVQPDPVAAHAGLATRLAEARGRREWVTQAARATGESEDAVEAVVAAAEFGALRRRMNLEHLAELRKRLPAIPRTLLPLFREDVQGLRRLGVFEAALFDPQSADHAA